MTGLTQLEQAVLAIAFVGLTVSGLLIQDGPFENLFNSHSSSESQITIGNIVEQKNDTRLKRTNSFAWLPSYEKAKVQGGDSVFTGEDSTAEIQLFRGDALILQPNSLVSFKSVDGVSIPRLDLGTFRIESKGKVVVSIRGKVTEITGNHSSIELVLEPEKPAAMRVTEGTAKIEFAEEAPIELTPTEELQVIGPAIPEVDFVEEKLAEEPTRPRIEPDRNIVLSSQDQSEVILFQKVEDLYDEPAPNLLVLKKDPSDQPRDIFRTWSPAKDLKARWIQISDSPDFTKAKTFSIPSTEDGKFLFPQVNAGSNFWRLSMNQILWSNHLEFKVKRQLRGSPPPPPWRSRTLLLTEEVVAFNLHIPKVGSAIGYILESSDRSDFPPVQTKLTWSPNGEFPLEFPDPKTIYFRHRTINQQKEVSAFSSDYALEVVLPPPPKLPAITAETKTTEPAQPEREVASTSEFNPLEDVGQQKVSLPPLMDETEPNSAYRSSRLVLMGSLFSMLSKPQVETKLPNSQGDLLQFGFENWWETFGFETKFKSKLASASGSTQSSPQNLEAKASQRYRSFFSNRVIPELTFLFFGGIEIYRNPTAGTYYSPKYDLFKGGLGLRFPLFSSWASGGDLAFGLGSEASRKYEMSGFIDYHLDRRWSLGAGYKLHMFDAQSTTTSPGTLPHREAYGEAFSNLKWSY